MRRLIFGAVLAAVIALVFGVLVEGGGKVQADHTVTITAEANGLLDFEFGVDCGPVPNGPFTISCTVPQSANTITGDGIDDVTTWTFDFTNEDNFQECFGGALTSALLTLTLTSRNSLITTDSTGIPAGANHPGGGILISSTAWTPDFLPALTFPPGDTKTATVNLLNPPTTASSLTVDTITKEFNLPGAGEIRMRYQDDATVTFAQLELTCEAPHVFGDKMYWTDAGAEDKIQRANLDGSGVEDLVTAGLGRPIGIALDRLERKMYWTDGDLDTIQRAAMLVNPVVEPPLVTGPSDRVGLALDLINGKMYWADFLGSEIKRADLNGKNEELLVNTQCCPVDIALDVGAGEMYWTLRLGVDKIQRAPMTCAAVLCTSSEVTDLLTAVDGLIDPRGIALDLVDDMMYWADNGDNTIKRADMAVKPAVTTLVDTGLDVPLLIALDVFDRKMYWTDAGNHTIKRAAMAVDPVVTILVDGPNDGLDIPIGIALDVAPDTGLIRDVVDGLPDSAFKAAPGGQGHKTAMLARLNAIQDDIENGEIDDAKDELQQLRLRVDGCDGSATEEAGANDWIVDCAAQREIRALIDLLLANLGC